MLKTKGKSYFLPEASSLLICCTYRSLSDVQVKVNQPNAVQNFFSYLGILR